MQIFLELLDRYGVSVTLLAVVIVGTWLAVTRIARWIRPHIDNIFHLIGQVFHRHIAMVDTLQSTFEAHGTSLAKLADHFESQAMKLARIEDKINADYPQAPRPTLPR